MKYIKVAVELSPKNEIASDLIIAQMGDLGFESFAESDNGFDAFIPSSLYNESLLQNIYSPIEGVQVAFKYEEIPDENWNKVWEENYFSPIIIGNEVIIRGPFHDKQEAIKYDILIEPKMSFGTGHHSTTSLMLQFILEQNLEGKTVLDMGCGTGVLGILCSKRQASSITGIDIDEWAYNNAVENITLNNVTNMTIMQGDASLLGQSTYDIILANINRNILLNDIQHYSQVLNTNGLLFLSGFYTEDLPIITEETKKHGFSFLSSKTDNNWVAAAYKKADV
ncbi:50S ribosomal protein L11 methyltransferase [Marinilabiliaceae bacterium JC017]|nr:50S ribosomal protein L11 methyltransferase [Marinilabiliaceae bacterium JC017]